MFVRDEWILASGTDEDNTYLLMGLPRDMLALIIIDTGDSSGSIGTLAVNPNER